MPRPLALLTALIAFFAIASSAHAAAPSCQRGGAKLVTANGNASVVTVKQKQPKSGQTRPDRIYLGCWAATGRRFELLQSYSDTERVSVDIIDGRYIGVVRSGGGGVLLSSSAATWDAQKHVAVHDTKPCNSVSPADNDEFEGIEESAFLPGGGIAYTCWHQSRVVDGKGDRALEPEGTVVDRLAFAAGRLYYTVDGATVKSIDL